MAGLVISYGALGCNRKVFASSTNGAAFAASGSRIQKAGVLWEWMVNKGGISKELVSVIVEDTPNGLGLFARRNISKGQELLSIPKSIWIDVETASSSKIGPFCEGLKPWVCIAVFLIYERSRGRESRWKEYIDVLPNTMDLPLFWSDEELAEIEGTQLLASVLGYKEFIQSEHCRLLEEVIKPRPDEFEENMFTLEAFTWAFGILRSRTFPPLVGNNLTLVPFADFVNHGTALTNEDPSWEIRSAGIFNRQETLVLRAPAYFRENEQVLMQYGKAKGNGQLALDYGFVERDGRNTSYGLTLTISDSDRFVDDKLDIAEMNGLNKTSYFDVHKDKPPPEELLAFLRLVALDGTDAFLLESLFRNSVWEHLCLPVSRDNEEAICEAVLDGCKATLSSYSTTVKEDLELLDGRMLSPRKEVATVVRLGEKQALLELQLWFETHRSKLSRLEYYAERRLRSLGLLDDKGSMTPWVMPKFKNILFNSVMRRSSTSNRL